MSAGKNVKRSIHGMGQIMSTMVLNRKQSLFGGPGARGAGLGAGLVLDGQRGSKDSIDKMDLTVMDTKLKILEILQVTDLWVIWNIHWVASVLNTTAPLNATSARS